jgi:hypothetical protein
MDRRQMMFRLPLFGAAVALPTATLAAVGAVENPELLALGAELDRRIADNGSAIAARRQVRVRFDAIVPNRPAETILHNRSDQQLYGCGETERDVEGNWVDVAPGRPRFIMLEEQLQNLIATRSRPRSSYRRDLRHRLCLLKAHESAVAAVMEASGLATAMEAEYWAADELRRIISDITNAEAQTADGLRLKARAMVAARGIEGHWGGNVAWAGPRLADAVLAVLGEAAR